MPSVPALQVAATLKLADVPATTVVAAGCDVIVNTGTLITTVSVAALLVTLPAALLTTARNAAPLSASTVAAIV